MATGQGTRVPPRFEHDDRVKVREGGGYTAVDDTTGKIYNILFAGAFDKWTICQHPSEQPMPMGNGCFARFYNTPSHAIAFAIGERSTAAVPA